MTAIELRAELLSQLSPILDNETLMEKTLKYIKRLTAKKPDPTLMSREEFYAMLEQGEEEFRQGKTYSMLPGESYADFRKRIQL